MEIVSASERQDYVYFNVNGLLSLRRPRLRPSRSARSIAALSVTVGHLHKSPRIEFCTLHALLERALGLTAVRFQGPGTYAYGYDIEDPVTGNIQFRQEERHANGIVTGSYGYVDANGTPQVTHYVSDENGYR